MFTLTNIDLPHLASFFYSYGGETLGGHLYLGQQLDHSLTDETHRNSLLLINDSAFVVLAVSSDLCSTHRIKLQPG